MATTQWTPVYARHNRSRYIRRPVGHREPCLRYARKRTLDSVRQSRQKLLLTKRRWIIQMSISAVTVDDLIFGPLDSLIEERELPQF